LFEIGSLVCSNLLRYHKFVHIGDIPFYILKKVYFRPFVDRQDKEEIFSEAFSLVFILVFVNQFRKMHKIEFKIDVFYKNKNKTY
jgi:hypothetical protein